MKGYGLAVGLVLGIAVSGCGGSGSDLDLTGVWSFESNLEASTCDLPAGAFYTESIRISHVAERIAISGSRFEGAGTIESGQITIPEGHLFLGEEEDCVTHVYFELGALATEDRITGTMASDVIFEGPGCAAPGRTCTATLGMVMVRD